MRRVRDQHVTSSVFSVSETLLSPVTPQDYQPPGFKEAEGDTLVFEKEPVKLTMGEVVTPYHTLKLGMATERHRLEQVKEREREPHKHSFR